ncbi:MAG TPA: type II secretion protein [Nitrospirota bacterium]|nr:type II secretion protein [Nitrospirota bacterium]
MTNDLVNDEFANAVIRQESEFSLLVDRGILNRTELEEAVSMAQARGVDLERVLLREFGVTKRHLLDALAAYYRCKSIEYDERLPIPPELLSAVSQDSLSSYQWMPVMKERSGTVVIAARNPESPAMRKDVKKYIKADRYEFRVTLDSDIQWYIQDFLHAKVGLLIGTERTGLASWRNTMAQWRTRMACYRTDLAKARTGLAFLRWGLGTIAISNMLLRSKDIAYNPVLYFSVLILGVAISFYGLPIYLNVRKSRLTPPGHQTLVEVTAATIQFLENYHFMEDTGISRETQGTMLARMGDYLAEHSTYLNPTPSSKTRTMFARERNVLAAQRTIAACYRTIYARARTGLAFIRTGISFLSIGIGIISYFGFGLLTSFNLWLMAAGVLMLVDGMLWYWPVRKEQAEIPRGIAYPE